jgi:hypothetical protein
VVFRLEACADRLRRVAPYILYQRLYSSRDWHNHRLPNRSGQLTGLLRMPSSGTDYYRSTRAFGTTIGRDFLRVQDTCVAEHRFLFKSYEYRALDDIDFECVDVNRHGSACYNTRTIPKYSTITAERILRHSRHPGSDSSFT